MSARIIRLLMWRNCLKRRRALVSSFCELVFPIFIVGIFIGLFQAFTPSAYPDKQYLQEWAGVPNLAGQGYRVANLSSVIAIGEASLPLCLADIASCPSAHPVDRLLARLRRPCSPFAHPCALFHACFVIFRPRISRSCAEGLDGGMGACLGLPRLGWLDALRS
jgi:hypothetical protein